MKRLAALLPSLLAATAIHANSVNPCAPPPRCAPQAPLAPQQCAYNAPAGINIGTACEIDCFLSASFIYWQSLQDNMNIGLVKNVSSSSAFYTQNTFVEMHFDFQPGFKIGAGMNVQNDGWDIYAEYTRVHGNQTRKSSGSSSSPTIYATWGQTSSGLSTGALPFESVSGRFRNNLDFVDLEIGRSCYVGQSLIVRPEMGVRGAWILQSMHISYSNPNLALASTTFNADVYARSHSWGVGPRGSMTMDWMVGKGWSVFGYGEADLLYTSYTVKDKTAYANTSSGPSSQIMTYDKVDGLRTHLDFEIGFGWASYFCNNRWHADLSASYGFQVFFDQNMFRHYNDDTLIAYSNNPNGNLYIQGLTATARFDF